MFEKLFKEILFDLQTRKLEDWIYSVDIIEEKIGSTIFQDRVCFIKHKFKKIEISKSSTGFTLILNNDKIANFSEEDIDSLERITDQAYTNAFTIKHEKYKNIGLSNIEDKEIN